MYSGPRVTCRRQILYNVWYPWQPVSTYNQDSLPGLLRYLSRQPCHEDNCGNAHDSTKVESSHLPLHRLRPPSNIRNSLRRVTSSGFRIPAGLPVRKDAVPFFRGNHSSLPRIFCGESPAASVPEDCRNDTSDRQDGLLGCRVVYGTNPQYACPLDLQKPIFYSIFW